MELEVSTWFQTPELVSTLKQQIQTHKITKRGHTETLPAPSQRRSGKQEGFEDWGWCSVLLSFYFILKSFSHQILSLDF